MLAVLVWALACCILCLGCAFAARMARHEACVTISSTIECGCCYLLHVLAEILTKTFSRGSGFVLQYAQHVAYMTAAHLVEVNDTSNWVRCHHVEGNYALDVVLLTTVPCLLVVRAVPMRLCCHAWSWLGKLQQPY